jgi:maleate cis-trans isomerase
MTQPYPQHDPGPTDTPVRARIGVIVPSANTRIEPDCYRLAPPGVTFHFARTYGQAVSLEEMERMSEGIDEPARHLASAGVDLLVYACTSGSFMNGAAYDRGLVRRMEEAAGVPATTTASCVVEALRNAGAQRVGVGTPYPDWLNDRIVAYLEENGFDVVALRGLGIEHAPDIALLPLEEARALGRDADRPDADAVLLSCTNLRALEVAADLEAELGKPVITSNQASIWAALRRTGIEDAVPGYGRLLDGMAPAKVAVGR